jgi:hypothetical protein
MRYRHTHGRSKAILSTRAAEYQTNQCHSAAGSGLFPTLLLRCMSFYIPFFACLFLRIVSQCCLSCMCTIYGQTVLKRMILKKPSGAVQFCRRTTSCNAQKGRRSIRIGHAWQAVQESTSMRHSSEHCSPLAAIAPQQCVPTRSMEGTCPQQHHGVERTGAVALQQRDSLVSSVAAAAQSTSPTPPLLQTQETGHVPEPWM